MEAISDCSCGYLRSAEVSKVSIKYCLILLDNGDEVAAEQIMNCTASAEVPNGWKASLKNCPNSIQFFVESLSVALY